MTVSAARTIVIASPASTYGVLLRMPSLRWPMAGPDEVLDYSLDVSALLSDTGGDTIASAVLSVAPSGTGELVAAALSITDGVITGWLGPGVPGRNYTVRIEVVSNGGRTFQRDIGLLVDPELAVYPLPGAPSSDFGTPLTWNPGAIVAGPPLHLVDTGLIAIGTNQATALPLGALTNVFTGGAAGAGGVLPTNVLSGTIFVQNADPASVDKLVYPPLGAAIGSQAVNVAAIVSPGQRIAFVTSGGLQWFAA
jgi:hypothetical protein